MRLINRFKRLLFRSNENKTVVEVENIIGYRFRQPSLLFLALTHRSFNKTNKENKYLSNERLEYLGDSVLGLVIADRLYHDYPNQREGRLTKIKALLVNETTLFNIGVKTNLNQYIRMSSDEDKLGGRERPSIVSDSIESIIGAVYLDGGLGPATDVVLRLIYTRKSEILNDKSQRNYKGDLLEYIQARGAGMPHYRLVNETGPDHEKEFVIDVYVNGTKLGNGTGFTKKEAEQKAAAMALEAIKKTNPE